MTILRHDRLDMPGASIAGRQLATIFWKYFASVPPVRKTPARDHQIGLRSPKPVTLRTVDAGYRSEANLKNLAGADISALIAANGMRERDGRGKTSHWIVSRYGPKKCRYPAEDAEPGAQRREIDGATGEGRHGGA